MVQSTRGAKTKSWDGECVEETTYFTDYTNTYIQYAHPS